MTLTVDHFCAGPAARAFASHGAAAPGGGSIVLAVEVDSADGFGVAPPELPSETALHLIEVEYAGSL